MHDFIYFLENKQINKKKKTDKAISSILNALTGQMKTKKKSIHVIKPYGDETPSVCVGFPVKRRVECTFLL